jgi:hypothetical protein
VPCFDDLDLDLIENDALKIYKNATAPYLPGYADFINFLQLKANLPLAKLVAANPNIAGGIFHAWSLAKKFNINLPNDQLIKLGEDLSNATGLAAAMYGNAGLVRAWEVLYTIESDLRIDILALSKLIDDIGLNPALETFLKNNPSKREVWELMHKTFYSHDIDVLNYVDDLRNVAKVGNSSTTNYTQTFFSAFPNQSLQGNGFVVHHAIEQQVLTKYPGLFTANEIHSLQNLRGISPEINSPVHLSRIRLEWDAFYAQFPLGINPTKEQVLDKATEIDNILGSLFSPPIRSIE